MKTVGGLFKNRSCVKTAKPAQCNIWRPTLIPHLLIDFLINRVVPHETTDNTNIYSSTTHHIWVVSHVQHSRTFGPLESSAASKRLYRLSASIC